MDIMNEIFTLYENMDELVYVSDIDTYEIVYMNKKTREQHHIKSVDELKGKKCYEVLQDSAYPCAMCNNKNLKVGQYDEWTYFNPILNKSFALKDTLIEVDGRKCRVEIAIDISALEAQKRTISEYADHEFVISEALRLSLSKADPKSSIEVLMEYLGKSIKSERVYIFEVKPDNTVDNTYEWCANDITPQKDNLVGVPISDVSFWFERFRENKNVIINDIEDTKFSDPVMYDYLKPQDIKSLMVTPLIYNNDIIGFYGVDNPPVGSMNNVASLFMIMGHFIVALLRRRDLFKRLETLSFYDALTGFRNRHAMEECISTICPGESIGLVYCDVMGLKKVNDTEGHHAGDALLVRATECIKKSFSEHFCFRIGGDEFLVLCEDIAEDELMAKVDKLKLDMKENNAVMAIGFVWRPDSRENVYKLLTKADELMYENKRYYYSCTE
jgi:diguanylate cyclase (GGDEF)-like protein